MWPFKKKDLDPPKEYEEYRVWRIGEDGCNLFDHVLNEIIQGRQQRRAPYDIYCIFGDWETHLFIKTAIRDPLCRKIRVIIGPDTDPHLEKWVSDICCEKHDKMLVYRLPFTPDNHAIQLGDSCLLEDHHGKGTCPDKAIAYVGKNPCNDTIINGFNEYVSDYELKPVSFPL